MWIPPPDSTQQHTICPSDLWHVAVASTGLGDIVDVLQESVETRHLWTHLLHCVGHTEDWKTKTSRRHLKKNLHLSGSSEAYSRQCRNSLTGSLSRGFGVEHRQRVVGVQVGLQERHRHGTHQGRQTLPQRWKMSAES